MKKLFATVLLIVTFVGSSRSVFRRRPQETAPLVKTHAKAKKHHHHKKKHKKHVAA